MGRLTLADDRRARRPAERRGSLDAHQPGSVRVAAAEAGSALAGNLSARPNGKSPLRVPFPVLRLRPVSELRSGIIEQTAAGAGALDPYSSNAPKFVVVVDADALLSSVDNHCRTGWESRLLRMAASSATCVYAADHVYGETYRGFRRLAASGAASIEELTTCFEEHYLPVVRWVETDGDGINDERVALVTDVTDVPTAELACLIAPCLVLSQDRALRRPGFAPDEWRVAAGHGADIVEAFAKQQAAAMALGLPAVTVVGGSIRLGHAVRAPWWASLAVLGVGGYVLLRSPQRRKLIGEKVWPFVEVIGQAMAEAAASEKRASAGLKEVMLKPSSCPTVKQQVATVLARSPDALLATEIQARIASNFDAVAPTAAEVRAILNTAPEFARLEPHRWQFGRASAAWRQALTP